MLSGSDIQGKGFSSSDGLIIVVIVSLIGGFTWSMLQGILNPPTLSPIGIMGESIGELSTKAVQGIKPDEPFRFQFPTLPQIKLPNLFPVSTPEPEPEYIQPIEPDPLPDYYSEIQSSPPPPPYDPCYGYGYGYGYEVFDYQPYPY